MRVFFGGLAKVPFGWIGWSWVTQPGSLGFTKLLSQLVSCDDGFSGTEAVRPLFDGGMTGLGGEALVWLTCGWPFTDADETGMDLPATGWILGGIRTEARR